MRITVLFSFLLFLSLSIRAGTPGDEPENSTPKRWKKGFVVTLRGDTIKGKIKTPEFLDVYYDFHRLVDFRKGKDSAQYSPDQLSSFSYYQTKDSLITLQSVSSPDGDGRIFMQLYCSGDCKVYGLTLTEVRNKAGESAGDKQMHSSLLPTEKKYIQLRGGEFIQLKRFGFKKSMKEAFESCPYILSGLESNKYSYDKWPEMVSDYNQKCK
jgi:hypothetical protein